MNVDDLSGSQLDLACAVALGKTNPRIVPIDGTCRIEDGATFRPTVHWHDLGPLLGIDPTTWVREFVKSKLGPTVEFTP